MKKIKENFKIEYLFYFFLVISPFLDAFSFWYREWFPNASFSPVTILRLIIPSLLLLFIFIKDGKSRKVILLGGVVYFLYALGHLVVYQHFLTKSAYGGILQEGQYLLNYTYMVLLFYIVYYFMKKQQLSKVYQFISYFLAGYVFLLYLSLVTGTSSPTYIDGVGYKGWNASGNAIGSLLLISLVILLPYFFKNKKWYHFLLLFFTGVYLMVFLGTKVGLLGFPLILVVYLICNFLYHFKHIQISKKRVLIASLIFLISGISAIILISHSSTLQRQKNLEKEQNQVVEEETKQVSHITGDALDYVLQIEKGKMDSKFMDFSQQKALVQMKNTADKWKLDNSNRRVQQFLYHTYLIGNQKSISRILFGNGYFANYDEMTLEMELISLLYNFGILGFVLYLGCFIWLEVKAVFSYFRNPKKYRETYLFYLFGVAFVYALSLMAGYTFFHVSCMIAIVLLHLLLNEEKEKVNKSI